MDPVDGTVGWSQVLNYKDMKCPSGSNKQIQCEIYGEGCLREVEAPFKAFVAAHVLALADVHAHLSDYKGAGLLLGQFDGSKRYVRFKWLFYVNHKQDVL